MNKIIEFKSRHGLIKIESSDSSEITKRDFSAGGTISEKAKEEFEESIDIVNSLSSSVFGKLNGKEETFRPDEIEIKVGLKFTAEAGAFIAKTSAEGNLEVTIKWKKKENSLIENAAED